jgi:oxygen-independent coproporphyrinogen III oxidase
VNDVLNPSPQSLIPRIAPGIYVHVPFCAAICNYCNFNRGLFDEDLKTRFVNALLEEIRIGARESLTPHPSPLTPDTLYFGGGTPSLLSPQEIRAVIDQCREAFGLAEDAEITMEANPETVDADRLEGFRHAGVNRLSFGVQSFRDEELQRLGRLHSAARAGQAVQMARGAGFENISLDLMMSLPGQRTRQWMSSVATAIDLAPEHISLYILEVYPHLPLRQDIDRHGWEQPADDETVEMYETAMSMLDAADYAQYEISNVCRKDRHSRHNLKYWTDGEWWGFGPGAHSTWRGSRWRNLSSTEEYVQRIGSGGTPMVDCRRLPNDERLGDALFTGLRLTEGIDLDIMSTRYGIDVWQRFGGRLAPFCEAGILLKQDARLRLTRQGMLMANEVMSIFV